MKTTDLFPVVDLPGTASATPKSKKYSPSVYFDYTTGDFLRDGSNRMLESNGKDAYIQWCMKACSTERESFLAYSRDYGVEFEKLARIPDRESRELEIERQITDALMVNPATEYVRDFVFRHSGDECHVTFTVKGYAWEEELMATTVKVG